MITYRLPVVIVLMLLSWQLAQAAQPSEDQKSVATLEEGFDKLPTYIKSDTLTLKSEEKLFVYSGNVEVLQGDMTLTSDILEGTYDENNKIQQLVARQNVVIIKGDGIRAHGERATYEAATETVLLTENPELQQNGSVLTADLIKIFLKENRSAAEGSVRVKLVSDKEKSAKTNKQFDIKSAVKGSSAR